MPVFLSMQGFQKYNLFPQSPPVGSQIGRRSSEEARFPVNFSGQTVAFWRQPPPPRGRSLRSLRRGISFCANPLPFHCFPIPSFTIPTSISMFIFSAALPAGRRRSAIPSPSLAASPPRRPHSPSNGCAPCALPCDFQQARPLRHCSANSYSTRTKEEEGSDCK